MERVGAAAVILNGRGEILLVHHTYGKMNWELPGGAGEPGESPVETAVREVWEETSLKAKALVTTGWYYDSTVDKMGVVFLCEVEAGEPRHDGEEISECRYWPTDALPRPMSDWTALRIADALHGQHFPVPTVIGPRAWLEPEVA